MSSVDTIERINYKDEPTGLKFSVKNMDRTADPLKDFYRFANGSWLDSNPIPPDKSQWGGFTMLRDSNLFKLGKIVEDCAFSKREKSPLEKMVGDFYISVMDQKTIEEKKFSPIKPIIERIDHLKKKSEIPELIYDLHSQSVFAFFNAGSGPDEKNSSIYSFYLFQGGLSLPNRDYYLQEGFSSLRTDYLKHVEKMFRLYGEDDEKAKKYAKTVLEIETEIAKSSRPQADLRDTEKNYNRVEKKELGKKFGHIDMNRYLEMANVPNYDYIVVGQPEVVEAVGGIVDKYTVEDLKTYLKWNVLHAAAPLLHKEVEEEDFDLFRRKVMGQKEPEKRWKKAVSIIDGSIGEALGQLYVEKEFGKEARDRMEVMVNDIRAIFHEKLKNLPWMTETTKEKALEKFSKFRPKIGFPSKWVDYSSVKIDSSDFLNNVLRSQKFEFHRQTSRVNEKVDRELWYMTPPTVNAYFSPTENEIVFPAGILQPPFFDKDMDDAVNYGGIGGVISHEITHGFDDQGRTFDAEGNIRDWWTEEDAVNFKERADKVVKLYDSLEPLPELHVNGKLTLGENIADLGGVSIAFEALQRRLEKEPSLRKNVDGFTPEQRFFLSWAQIWRANTREEEIKMRVSIDPHAPANFRGAIPPSNHEKFEDAFSQFSNSKGTSREKIFIW